MCLLLNFQNNYKLFPQKNFHLSPMPCQCLVKLREFYQHLLGLLQHLNTNHLNKDSIFHLGELDLHPIHLHYTSKHYDNDNIFHLLLLLLTTRPHHHANLLFQSSNAQNQNLLPPLMRYQLR